MQFSAVIRGAAFRGVVCGCLIFFAAAGAAQTRTGTVKKVFDGDTVQLASGEIVRLLGIDAPESNYRNRKVLPQPFYFESRAALAKLVDRKKVLLQVGTTMTGHFGRTLAYLHLPDGTDVQQEMLRGGFAMLTAYPPDLAHWILTQKWKRAPGKTVLACGATRILRCKIWRTARPKKTGRCA